MLLVPTDVTAVAKNGSTSNAMQCHVVTMWVIFQVSEEKPFQVSTIESHSSEAGAPLLPGMNCFVDDPTKYSVDLSKGGGLRRG